MFVELMRSFPVLDIAWFQDQVRNENFQISAHALQRLLERSIDWEDALRALLNGKIIADYQSRNDFRGHACLIAGSARGRILYIVVAKTPKGQMRLCTVFWIDEQSDDDLIWGQKL